MRETAQPGQNALPGLSIARLVLLPRCLPWRCAISSMPLARAILCSMPVHAAASVWALLLVGLTLTAGRGPCLLPTHPRAGTLSALCLASSENAQGQSCAAWREFCGSEDGASFPALCGGAAALAPATAGKLPAPSPASGEAGQEFSLRLARGCSGRCKVLLLQLAASLQVLSAPPNGNSRRRGTVCRRCRRAGACAGASTEGPCSRGGRAGLLLRPGGRGLPHLPAKRLRERL